MPEEQCRDIEIVDGMVQMSPKPTPVHQIVARRIADAIDRAGMPDWATVLDVDLRLRDIPLLNRQPDVVVFRAETDLDRLIPVGAVLGVVEVVSPGSESTDRIMKPVEYAAAGIPHYWRVESAGGQLVLHTSELGQTGDAYGSTGQFTGRFTAKLGFPVEIDFTRFPTPPR
jgi:Uma2 family endonuclease